MEEKQLLKLIDEQYEKSLIDIRKEAFPYIITSLFQSITNDSLSKKLKYSLTHMSNYDLSTYDNLKNYDSNLMNIELSDGLKLIDKILLFINERNLLNTENIDPEKKEFIKLLLKEDISIDLKNEEDVYKNIIRMSYKASIYSLPNTFLLLNQNEIDYILDVFINIKSLPKDNTNEGLTKVQKRINETLENESIKNYYEKYYLEKLHINSFENKNKKKNNLRI